MLHKTDPILTDVIRGAINSKTMITVIIRLQNDHTEEQKQEMQRAGLEVRLAIGPVITGNIEIGKIRQLEQLPFIFKISASTKVKPTAR